MIRIIFEYIRAFIISLEFVVILLAVVFHQLPDFVSPVSSAFKDSPDILKYFALLPLLLAIWTFKEAKKLLFPSEDQAKVLQLWGHYRELKVIYFVSLIYAVFFAVTGLVSWAIGIKISDPNGFVLFLMSIIGSLIVAGSIYFASDKINEIFLQNRL